jgi:hypothetical protein
VLFVAALPWDGTIEGWRIQGQLCRFLGLFVLPQFALSQGLEIDKKEESLGRRMLVHYMYGKVFDQAFPIPGCDQITDG